MGTFLDIQNFVLRIVLDVFPSSRDVWKGGRKEDRKKDRKKEEKKQGKQE